MKNKFLTEFENRGFLHQATDIEKLKELADQKPLIAYLGFDCTAESLHVGHLMQIMILRLLQKTGNKPIVLLGGGTTKIGDPTGKDKSRKMLSDEDIARNMAGIKANLSKYIKFGDGPTDALLVNNDEWLRNIQYIEFLRDYGMHFSINRMLTMDSVKLRLEREQNLSFLEFNYMIFQGYDFYHLHKTYSCNLQIGGSDQWGNIVTGIDFARRVVGAELYGLTTPLVTTASGLKMGKSENGAIWLSEELLSPFDYFQFWRNTEDADVIKFAKLLTDLEGEDLVKLENLAKTDINAAKKILAFEATKLCHGNEKAENAAKTAQSIFENKSNDDIEGLPVIFIDKTHFETSISAFQLFVLCNLSESNSEAKKLIRGGGAKINDIKIEDENIGINKSHLTKNSYIKLSAGKKRHIIVKIQ